MPGGVVVAPVEGFAAWSAFDWNMPLRLLASMLLVLPTGWNRERETGTVGLRTIPLVSLGACGYALLASASFGDVDPDAMSRILQGLMMGIGFVGGGAILKNEDRVEGTATAASIWVVGAVGAATGLGLWALAVSLAVMNLALIVLLGRLKARD
jgi:putative Mg2+ transporter-C (MgtC) family protein